MVGSASWIKLEHRQSCAFNYLQETVRKIRHACTFAYASDNNPLNDGKQRETGRSNDEANEKDPSNSGKLLQEERRERVQAKEGEERRASEQITEVYENMTGETGMTKTKKDEVVRDKEIVLIVMEKQKEVSQAEKEPVWRWNNVVEGMWCSLKQWCCQVLITAKPTSRHRRTHVFSSNASLA